MPARLPSKGVYATPKGEYNTKKKTYTGKGKAPSGSKKVAEPSYSEVPTVTVSSSGTVTSSGYSSQKAASVAQKRARATTRRARAILRPVKTSPQNAAKRAASKPKPYAPPKVARAQAVKVAPPTSKPVKYEGKKTAGTPSLKELQTGSKSGTLKVNKKGFVTTAPVRRAAKTVKKLQGKARKSNAPLPGLDAKQTQTARVVLNKGRKAKATPKEMLAAAETGLVESSFRNLPTSLSDGTSAGWRQATEQERYGPESRRRKPGPTAEDFFSETASAGRGAGQTAGELAQTVQGSAYPERYDQRAGEAKAIVSAYNKGGLKPAQAKKLKKAKAKASELGLSAGKKKGGVSGPSRIPSVVYIGKQAEKKFGLHVGENPAFGGVEPVHAENSFHYRTDAKGRGEAIDVSGDPAKMLAFDHWVAKKWGQGVSELFYDPGISIDEGTVLSSGIGGHEDHVHVAVAMPGEKIGGGVAVGSGGAMFIGYGSSASAAVASAANARKAAAKGKGKHQSPYASAWKKLHKLDELKVGTASPTPTQTERASAPSTSELARLQKKYGAAA